MSQVPSLNQIVSGDADDPSKDMANWNAIRNVVNGSLDTTNLSSSAGITAAQTVFGTFTDWTTWTPGYVGFSANPTVSYSKYCRIGKHVTVVYSLAGAGTSNSVNFAITGLPVAASSSLDATNGLQFWVRALDGGVALVSPAVGGIGAGSTQITFYRDGNTTSWTNTGGKGVYSFSFTYPVD